MNEKQKAQALQLCEAIHWIAYRHANYNESPYGTDWSRMLSMARELAGLPQTDSEQRPAGEYEIKSEDAGE